MNRYPDDDENPEDEEAFASAERGAQHRELSEDDAELEAEIAREEQR